ncbi:PRC-barrel domain-containing protein [Brucella gallinifaecis]|uniref:PRC-barrel domain containing protein n=1 Tax=Brucella gallinifaecis TaxID=215590 RepID=A0A502BQB1_9HYPH|nr:PRC-barrel domain-containing protein [Brucella gallinifaecis]TPF75831.1 PRC-barrel domain containing protein [Brucella gallinifaecis]
MLRTTLLTTTCALFIGGSAFAQTATPAPAEVAPAAADLPVSSQNMFGSPSAEDTDKIGFIEAKDGQILVSSFIGQTVYESDAADAASVGKLNDLIVSPEGQIQAAIIGVGGFLGVGEKDVAVSPDQLQLAKRSDGKKWLVIKASKDQLTEAPVFDRSALFVDGVADSTASSVTNAPAVDTPASDPAPAPAAPAPAQ